MKEKNFNIDVFEKNKIAVKEILVFEYIKVKNWDNKNYLILDFEMHNNDKNIYEMGAIQFKVQDEVIIIEKIVQKLYKFNDRNFNFYNSKYNKNDFINKQKFDDSENFQFIYKLSVGRKIIVFDENLEKKILKRIYTRLSSSDFNYSFYDIKKEKYAKNKSLEKLAYENNDNVDFQSYKNEFHKALFDCFVIFEIFYLNYK